MPSTTTEAIRSWGPSRANRVASRIVPTSPMPIRKFAGSSAMPIVLESTKNKRGPFECLVQGHTRPRSQPEALVMTHHHLHSSPETCHWGFFEAKLKPVLTVKSGDEVTIDTLTGGPEIVPERNQ